MSTETYWYYQNGTYELCKTYESNGFIREAKRHVKGPIPFPDLLAIINDPEPISAVSKKWQSKLVERLQGAHFITENILETPPQKVHRTYWRSITDYCWNKIAPLTAPFFPPPAGYLPDPKEKDCRCPTDDIPEEFAQDPILQETICSLSKKPVRIPAECPQGHMFNGHAIDLWILQKASCPECQTPLTFRDLIVDHALSDKIEMRLLLLHAHKQVRWYTSP